MRFRENGLYIFLGKDPGRKAVFQARSNLATTNSRIWHKRLDHLSDKKLNYLHVMNYVIPKHNKNIYSIFPLAK